MHSTRRKIKSFREIQRIVIRAKRMGKTVVTTNGCFDLLHVGHVRNLEHAKSLGDLLIVGVNSDASVRMNKGRNRPIVPQKERAEVLAALTSIDYVFIFSSKTSNPWLEKLKPHVHAKGGDRTIKQITEREVLKKIGTTLVLIPYVKEKSTTNMIRRAVVRHSR